MISKFLQLPTIMKYRKRNLPNLIIIGAQKCGTTSLHYYLGLHPQISMSKEKELNFFLGRHNWNKGIEWYKSNFTGKARIYGESSPSYTTYPFSGAVPERMYSIVPEAKLIYILRDPIDRIISHYIHNCTIGREDRTIEAAVSPFDSSPYVCFSKYYMQLEQYLAHFPKSNIIIITLEELYYQRRLTLQKLFKILNVDDSFYHYKFLYQWHKSKFKRRKTLIGLALEAMPVMKIINLLPFEMRGVVEKLLFRPFSKKVRRPVLDERFRRKLIDFLRDDVNRLREYTGCDFEEFCD